MSPGSPLKPKQLKTEIKSGKIYSRYLFTGEEEGEKDKIISAIRSTLYEDREASRISTGIFHAENDELMQAADFALSTSMFSPMLLCIVKNIDLMKQNKTSLPVLEEMINSLPKSTTLIMTTVKNRPPAFMKKEIISKFRQVQFWRYFENDLAKYTIAKLSSSGLPISMEAVDQILEFTGRDIKKIDDAVEVLSNSGIDGEISASNVRFLVENTRGLSVFDFVENLFAKNKESLTILQRILEEGRTGELNILAIIKRQAELIEKFHSLVDDGADINTAMKKCGVFDSKKDLFLRSAEQFNIETLKHIFSMIADADRKIKTGIHWKSIINNPVFYLASEIIIRY